MTLYFYKYGKIISEIVVISSIVFQVQALQVPTQQQQQQQQNLIDKLDKRVLFVVELSERLGQSQESLSSLKGWLDALKDFITSAEKVRYALAVLLRAVPRKTRV